MQDVLTEHDPILQLQAIEGVHASVEVGNKVTHGLLQGKLHPDDRMKTARELYDVTCHRLEHNRSINRTLKPLLKSMGNDLIPAELFAGWDGEMVAGEPNVPSAKGVKRSDGPSSSSHRPGKQRRPVGGVVTIKAEKLKDAVDEGLRTLVERIPEKCWGLSSAPYRAGVKSINFGLQRVGKFLGMGSSKLQDVEAVIIQAIVAHVPMQKFTTITINKYSDGVGMGGHIDGNVPAHALQLAFVWGDFTGGKLVLRGPGEPVDGDGVGVWQVDGNCPQEVMAVETGVMYSIVTSARNVLKTPRELLDKLQAAGYALPMVSDVALPVESEPADTPPKEEEDVS